jgi:hypothetical protein
MTASTPTSTLTERYVSAVLRSVPSGDRPELEREVRALIADAIDAKAADGTLDTIAAERAALTELGDPGALAARYTGRINYLLGPGIYPAWRGIITVVLAVLIPLLSIVVFTASLIGGSEGGSDVGSALAAAIATAFNAGVQTVFWFTLVFVIIERVASAKDREELASAAVELGRAGLPVGGGAPIRGEAWTVDDLPPLPDAGRMTISDVAGAIVANIVLIVGLLWSQVALPMVIDGQSYPLFDPALWSFWLPWFIAIAVLEIVFTLAVYRRGHWTYGYAIGNALLGAAFAIPALYLLANHLLFNPAFVEALGAESESWLQTTTVITGVIIVAIVAWDAIDVFRKARRAATSVGHGR